LGGKGALTFYKSNEQKLYHFAYLNSRTYFIINNSDLLLDGKSTTMFVQNQIFTIHLKNQFCSPPTAASLSDSLTDSLNNFLKTHYPKQKFLNLAFIPLIEKDLINDKFFFKIDENVHIVDFIRWLNNKFDKSVKPPPHLKSIIKNMQTEKIRFPFSCVQNPLAKRLFCHF
jgi:superfamily I DNA and/or RNA helicase